MIKMKLSKALKEFVAKVAQEDHYWVERAKLEFSADLERHRRLQNLSGKDLAEKIGTSPAYISKVFRGDSNFTIETMVKLARAVGGRLEMKITEEAESTALWQKAYRARPLVSTSSAKATGQSVIFAEFGAANNDKYTEKRVCA